MDFKAAKLSDKLSSKASFSAVLANSLKASPSLAGTPDIASAAAILGDPLSWQKLSALLFVLLSIGLTFAQTSSERQSARE